MKVQIVTLEIVYDDNEWEEPSKWDWGELSESSVKVLNCSDPVDHVNIREVETHYYEFPG